jgi:hypothetical protein
MLVDALDELPDADERQCTDTDQNRLFDVMKERRQPAIEGVM